MNRSKRIFSRLLPLALALTASVSLYAQATPDSRPMYLQEEALVSAGGEVLNPRTQPRALRYLPQGDAFVLQAGVKPRRFNRALYGGHDAFRLETGDTPEFGLYAQKGMMGNISLLLRVDGEALYLNDLAEKEVIYRPGQRIYRLADPRLGAGAALTLTAMAAYDCPGALFSLETAGLKEGVEFFVVFGGIRAKKFSRNGDLNVDPEDAFALHPDY